MSDTRALVINLGVSIEAEAALTLSAILNIDLESSRSLGDTNQALGFNHKITLIQDLKGLEKDRITKLQKFMEIRNKFAHVKKIDSFLSFKQELKDGESTIKKLEVWYSDKVDKKEDEEEYYRNLFIELYKDNYEFLDYKAGVHLIEKGLEQGKTDFQLGLLEILKEKLSSSEELGRILEISESEMMDKWEEKFQ